eukprot:1123068_1
MIDALSKVPLDLFVTKRDLETSGANDKVWDEIEGKGEDNVEMGYTHEGGIDMERSVVKRDVGKTMGVVRRIASISHNDDEMESDSDSDGMYEVIKGAPIVTRGGNHEKSVDLIGPKVANNEGNNDQINLELVNKVMDTQREGSQSLEEIGITAEGSGQDENVNPGIGASATQGYNAMSVVEGASTAK